MPYAKRSPQRYLGRKRRKICEGQRHGELFRPATAGFDCEPFKPISNDFDKDSLPPRPIRKYQIGTENPPSFNAVIGETGLGENEMKISRIVLLVVIGLLLLQPTSIQAQDGLLHFVNKYQRVKINKSLHKRLARHRHLINYFSSLYFVKPRHHVNPDFLSALIIAESSVDPKARSNKDARGLTQLLFSTARQAAMELAETGYPFRYVSHAQLRNLKPNDLYDPAINLLIASYLIAKYNHQYQGRIELVVSAWNAGCGSIVNNTPPRYLETMDLIGKVNGYYVALLKQRKLSAQSVSRRASQNS